jgi:hypothetical protein
MPHRTYQFWFRETNAEFNERKAVIMAGFVEAPVGAVMDWSVSPLLPTPSKSGTGLDGVLPMQYHHQPAMELFRDEIECGAMADSYLTRPWPIPTHREAGIALYRRTNMPAYHPSREVHAVIGLLAWPGADLDYTKIHVFEEDRIHDEATFKGHLGHDVRPDFDVPDMVTAARGNTVSQVMQMPIWGFSDEALSYEEGLMADHLREALSAATLAVASGQEIEDLPQDIHDILQPAGLLPGGMLGDKDYLVFLRAMYQLDPDHFTREFEAKTAQDKAKISELAREAINQVSNAPGKFGI